jgi:hypothetical protein
VLGPILGPSPKDWVPVHSVHTPSHSTASGKCATLLFLRYTSQMSLSSDVVKRFDPDEKAVATWKVKAGLAQMLKGGVIMGARACTLFVRGSG